MAQLGREDREQEKVLSLMEYLSELALKWYLQHVLHVNRTQEYWTFEDVIFDTTLYNAGHKGCILQDTIYNRGGYAGLP